MRTNKIFPSIATIVTAATMLTFQSCTKLASTLQYNLTMQSGSVTVAIPPVANTSTDATVGAGTNNINVDSFIKAHTAGLLGSANILSVKLKSCTMTIDNGSNANNFANFQSCHASFSSNAEVSPYQIGITNNPDAFSTSMTMPVDTTTELRGYMLGNQYNYSVGGKLRRATTDTLRCTINFEFTLRVQG